MSSHFFRIYLGLFPARHIGLFLPLGLYLQFARVPALLVIGAFSFRSI